MMRSLSEKLGSDNDNLSGKQRAIKHWKHVIKTMPMHSLSYRYAESALKQLGVYERTPGEDDV